MTQDRAILASLFQTAVEAADPEAAMAPYLPQPPKGRTLVVGAGKGAAQMATALETLWPQPLEGTVVTRYGFGCQTRQIKVLEAAHPVPDEAGLWAAQTLMASVQGLTEDDLVIALICGGGSALLPMPAKGLTLQDEIDLTKALLASGAPISVMNMIRKQVSQIKGGRLAAACHPAQVVSLIVSDVPGDDPAQVASGPTVSDPSTRQDALNAITNWSIPLPPQLQTWLNTTKDNSPQLLNTAHIIASAQISLEAAATQARAQGIPTLILSDRIEGEAREVARTLAAIAKSAKQHQQPFQTPILLLSGGETSVTLKHQGKGGRNTEFLLAFAIAAEGLDFTALAADTDGIDGSEGNAGAFATGTTAQDIRDQGLDPAALLATNNSWTAFHAIDALFTTGPTGTNVNDFRAIWIK